jgi:hypothetical protein
MLDRQDEKALSVMLEQAQENITLAGVLRFPQWRDLIGQLSRDAGCAPVVWVQDIQIDTPLDDYPKGELSEYDQVPIQLSGLRDLAEQTGAIIAVVHVLPGDEVGWRVVSGIADDTLVLEEDSRYKEDPQRRDVQLRHIDRHDGDRLRTATIDTTFWTWRNRAGSAV